MRNHLIGVPSDVEITWKEGSEELLAGKPTAKRLNTLTIHAVCRPCNNEWMQRLDNQVAKALLRWSERGSERLGRDHFHALRRYLTKTLWVIRVGEDWTSGAWIRGDRREPEFIPLSLIQDGKTIREPRSIEADLSLRTFLGAARVAQSSSDLFDIPPIPAEGITPTQKVRRLNAGLIVTFRAVGLRLWIVLSGLDQRWDVEWPRGVSTLSGQSKYGSLSNIASAELSAPTLRYRGPKPIPDVEGMFSRAFTLTSDSFKADR